MEHFEIAQRIEAYTSKLMDKAKVFEHHGSAVIVVADGVGGMSGGVQAAKTVVRMVEEALARSMDIYDPMDWCLLLMDVDGVIQDSGCGGESTAVMLAASSDRITGASVGDSAAWLIQQEGGYHDLTEGQRRKPLLGTGEARPVPFSGSGLCIGTLLVATDGLLKYTTPHQICKAALEPNIDQASRRLVDLVRLKSGDLWDDTTVVLCRAHRPVGS
jgi:serine/threonine protein phosphatase PrpC